MYAQWRSLRPEEATNLEIPAVTSTIWRYIARSRSTSDHKTLRSGLQHFGDSRAILLMSGRRSLGVMSFSELLQSVV